MMMRWKRSMSWRDLPVLVAIGRGECCLHCEHEQLLLGPTDGVPVPTQDVKISLCPSVTNHPCDGPAELGRRWLAGLWTRAHAGHDLPGDLQGVPVALLDCLRNP